MFRALLFLCDTMRRSCVTAATSGTIANDGGTLLLIRSIVGTSYGSNILRTELVRLTPQSEVVIGYIDDRCVATDVYRAKHPSAR
jgi:hypothetical protein